jgi:hypothetical protein
MIVLAIDPGSESSAFVTLNGDRMVLRAFGKLPNAELLEWLRAGPGQTPTEGQVVLEFMSPRGMPTSRQEMETLFVAGRIAEACHPSEVHRITRDDVKYHLTGRRSKVGDANVRAALIDRFGGLGGKAAAIGTKANPGPLYGVTADVWAALGVAITYLDTGGRRP